MTDIFTPQFLLEQKLGQLALKFRGSRTPEEQECVAREYEQAVRKLIDTGLWNEVPGPEEMLPDEFMPSEFDEHWKRLARG